MVKWILRRCKQFGTEEYELFSGNILKVGRGTNNNIVLPSSVVSRNHCELKVCKDVITVSDSCSVNGTFVGIKKIPNKIPYDVHDNDVLGFGWTNNVALSEIDDADKFVFIVSKENGTSLRECSSIVILDDVDEKPKLFQNTCDKHKPQSPILLQHSNKRKLGSDFINENKLDKQIDLTHEANHLVTVTENHDIMDPVNKKTKLDESLEPTEREVPFDDDIIIIKQEPNPIDEELIEIDSDSEDESQKWILKLSQNSPGRPLKTKQNKNLSFFDTSYSQQDVDHQCFEIADDEECDEEDPISLFPFIPNEEFSNITNTELPINKLSTDVSSRTNTISNGVTNGSIIEHSKNFLHSTSTNLKNYSNKITVSKNFTLNNKSYKESKIENGSVLLGNDEDYSKITDIVKSNNTDSVVSDSSFNNFITKVSDNTLSITNKLSDQSPHQIHKVSDLKASYFKSDSKECNKNTSKLQIKCSNNISNLSDKSSSNMCNFQESSLPLEKKTLMVDALYNKPRKQAQKQENKSDSKKHSKSSIKKTKITLSQKTERKEKLKHIAAKEKVIEVNTIKKNDLSKQLNKPKTNNIKVTATNRGAFLTDIGIDAVKSIGISKSKNSTKKPLTHSRENKNTNSSHEDSGEIQKISCAEEEMHKKNKSCDEFKKSYRIPKHKQFCNKSSVAPHKSVMENINTKNKSLDENDNTKNKAIIEKNTHKSNEINMTTSNIIGGKASILIKSFLHQHPHIKGHKKKQVRFSELPPEVHEFEIESKKEMRKVSSVNTTLIDKPLYSKEKSILMGILHWNPVWLKEQKNTKDPPPILGFNVAPMPFLQSFQNIKQYIKRIRDLLLMEIWERITESHEEVRKQLDFRIEHLPLPSQDTALDILLNISVNVSVLKSEVNLVPKVGEILVADIEAENLKVPRFFYVYQVKRLPSPPNNVHSFYSLSLNTTYTKILRSLKIGEVIKVRSLGFIDKQLSMFETIEKLKSSPIRNIILKPKPEYFPKFEPLLTSKYISKWTEKLNSSQQKAVMGSISATVRDQPSIQMVQGPPGTGKSKVICAIVMAYFYESNEQKLQNKGKILICATSNAAIDELVVRLLAIRKNLTMDKFKMVRVGRLEAMHPSARDISLQRLAAREAARTHSDQEHYASSEQIFHLEAKYNMWKEQAQSTNDSARAAFCQTRAKEIAERIAMIRSASGNMKLSKEMLSVEKRLLERADIIATTLASASSQIMLGLKGQIALCIVDEAGQAIEPDCLSLLSLGVTRLTLIGDPQQLPGYIKSEQARKFGLNESLFSRLASCTELWAESPVVLLDQQYRMQPAIAHFPSRAFYGGRVRDAPPPRPALPLPPYALLAIDAVNKGREVEGSNEAEAWGVARVTAALARRLRASGLSFAVITPYHAQKELIRKVLKTLMDSEQVEVSTVDSFQGQERDVVVASAARAASPGFLASAGRMNVMLTRARHAFLLCLNTAALQDNLLWRSLIDDGRERNVLRTFPQKFCLPNPMVKFTDDEILNAINK